MYSAYKLNKQGDNIQPWHTPFLIWNQSVVPCPVLTCFLTCKQISQEAGQVVWYSHLFKNFPQFVVLCTVKGFGIVNKAEVDVFLDVFFSFFSMIQRMLAIWSLVPLPFLNPAWTSGSSWFTYCCTPIFFFAIKNNFISLFLAVLDLHCCAGFSLVEESRAYCLVSAHGLLIAWLLLFRSMGFRAHVGSVIAVPGL